MTEGHDARYSSKVGFSVNELNLFNHSNSENLNIKINNLNELLLDNSISRDSINYNSDNEGSISGCTDTSSTCKVFTAPEPVIGFELSRDLGIKVHDLTNFGSVPMLINNQIENKIHTASFLVTNLASIIAQFDLWRSELPMVQPFYAVKCNPDPSIVKLLASLGCCFDCATMGEIDLVLNGLGDQLNFGKRGLAASSIVYANPAKMSHMLEFAADNNVRMTVFDGEDELYKIAAVENHKNFQLLLRLTTEDKASVCQFSKKFGCPVADAPKLLDIAHSLGLNVAGVSFHVGSGCGDAAAYSTALRHAAVVYEYAESIGMAPLHIIDIGGGFPGGIGGCGGPGMPSFQEIAKAVREGFYQLCVNLNRPMDSFRFIAEPGRFFVSSSTTICTKIYARKGGNEKYQALYVDDGVYGSFNNVVYDHALPVPLRLSQVIENECFNKSLDSSNMSLMENVELIPTAVFGPTCDGLDQMCSLDNTVLPRCNVGEWLIWEEQGAYTHTASYVFNGYTHIPKRVYCFRP